jgi:hypothetical protein
MRPLIVALSLTAAALLGPVYSAAGQSASSYRYCAISSFDGGRSCYFESREQCQQSGAAHCVDNPAYRPESVHTPGPAPAPTVDTARPSVGYAWCGIYPWDGGQTCYFESRELCLQSMTGIAGQCRPNAAYNPKLAAPAVPAAAVERPNRLSSDYAWCGVVPWDGSQSCYFENRDQCTQSMIGIGGQCHPNQVYRARAAAPTAAPAAAPVAQAPKSRTTR